MPQFADYEAAQAWLVAHPGVRFVDLLLPDLLGIPRGKRVTVEELAAVHRDGLLLPASMFALDVLGGTIQATGLGFDEGDADRLCIPLPGSLAPVPWLGGEVAQMQVAMYEHDRRPFYGDPRHALERVLERYHARGLTPVMAVELEFYFVDRERTPEGHAQPPRQPLSGRREYRTQINSMADLDAWSEVLNAIDAAARAQDLPVGTVLAEYGPGQFEVNLHHVADALLACDHAIRLKRLVKGVALAHGFEATFMPKPYRDCAGSGTHLHVSVIDRDERNIFAADDPAGAPALRHAIGGLASTIADTMAVCAPTANSFRRFQPEAYVPLGPSWAVNNRGVAFRVPHGARASRRIEHRVAGADANPYLLAAMVLGSMLRGIERQLDPGPPLAGNAYRDTTPALPLSWPEALVAFERSEFARDCLGERFARLYAQARRGEMQEFASHVTALDLAERGYDVVLLEGKRIAWGASGRSGGQAIFGFAAGQEKLVAQVGREAARRMFDVSVEALDLLKDRVARHAIDCDLNWGQMHVAIKPRHETELKAWRDELAADYGYTSLSWRSRDEVRSLLATERYIGGLYDTRSGHLHPLNYTLGLAAAAESAGVRIFEDSQVARLEQGSAAIVHTDEGRVRTRHVALCCNAYVDDLAPKLRARIMPVGTYIVATEPLGQARCEALMRENIGVTDVNWVLDYFRRSADHRLLFGGRVSYSGLDPRNTERATRARMLKVFPQLADVKIEYAWGGYVDITMSRAPDFGRLAPNVYYLQGFSGHGIALTGMAGRLVAEAIAGQAERFDLFTKLEHRDFPGGRALRTPALVLAMLWFRLKDLI